MSEDRQYSDAMLAGMQAAYGDGFLSPGAAPDMRCLLDGLDVRGARVLDLGCGVGGAALMFAGEFGVQHVTAADPESAALAQTERRVAEAGLAGMVDAVLIEAGPLPFAAGTFDLVYSKDVICHVADKAKLFADVHRVLDAGGQFTVGDWTVGRARGGEHAFVRWERHLADGGLRFRFESVDFYEAALRDAGFRDIETIDRTAWFLESAAGERAALEGENRAELDDTLGPEAAGRRIALTRARHEALTLGGLAYHHVRARKG